MSIGFLTTSAPSLFIPVTDELIKAPENAPKQQQLKIAAYNELLEDVYLRKTELESLEGRLAAMKVEIEGDIEHLELKGAEKAALKAQKHKSGATAIAAFVRSGSPVQVESEVAPKANPNAAANGVAAAIANLRSVAGTTKGVKSRGKGKGKQEKAKLNGTDLKYYKGRQIDLDGDDYAYDDEEDNEGYDGEEEGCYEESSQTSSTEARFSSH